MDFKMEIDNLKSKDFLDKGIWTLDLTDPKFLMWQMQPKFVSMLQL